MLFLDHIHQKLRRVPFLLRFTILLRILLAVAFIPTGMVKLLGQRFTLMRSETPIGAFFEAMYQTGLYWQFLGLSQVVAGVLLFVPALAHLGALLFLPIVANILVITIALDFGGTPWVVGAMSLAAVCLAPWDYHRWRSLFTSKTGARVASLPEMRLDPLERLGFVVFASCLPLAFGATRTLVAAGVVPVLVLLGVAAGLFTLLRFFIVQRRSRSARRALSP